MSSSSISDLTLDHNPSSLLTMAMNSTTTTPTPSTGGDFFKGLGGEDPTRLEEHLRALTEERQKVAAFRRELPFCMHLLNKAIEASKEKLDAMPMLRTRDRKQQTWAIGIDDEVHHHLKNNSGEGPFLEDLIPLKTRLVCEKSTADVNNDGSQNRGKEQWGCFWSRQEEGSLLPVEKPWISSGEKFDPLSRGQESNMVRKPYFHSKNSREGGAFSPFSKDMSMSRSEPDETPHRDLLSTFKPCGDEKEAFKRSVNSPGGQQNQRKPRRCWSHELHCRFVNALQQLGGPHVATPKQIRELMKVDGLTNDEVKSHLQKYRLHTRRLSPPAQVAAAASLVPHQLPQLVVLGGIWAPPPDHYSNPYTTTTTANTNTTTTTSTHNNQLHLYQPTVVNQGLCTRAMMSSASSHPFVHCNTQTLTLEDHSAASRRGLSQCSSGQSEEEEDINCSGREESSDEHGSHWKNGSPPQNGSTWLHQSLSHAHNQ